MVGLLTSLIGRGVWCMENYLRQALILGLFCFCERLPRTYLVAQRFDVSLSTSNLLLPCIHAPRHRQHNLPVRPRLSTGRGVLGELGGRFPLIERFYFFAVSSDGGAALVCRHRVERLLLVGSAFIGPPCLNVAFNLGISPVPLPHLLDLHPVILQKRYCGTLRHVLPVLGQHVQPVTEARLLDLLGLDRHPLVGESLESLAELLGRYVRVVGEAVHGTREHGEEWIGGTHRPILSHEHRHALVRLRTLCLPHCGDLRRH